MLSTNFNELFSDWTYANNPHQAKPGKVSGQAVTRKGKLKPATMDVGPHISFLMVGGEGGCDYGKATPSAALVAAVQQAMVFTGPDDSIYFQVIVWDGDPVAHLHYKHNRIIGGRLLGTIDAATIPAEVFNDG